MNRYCTVSCITLSETQFSARSCRQNPVSSHIEPPTDRQSCCNFQVDNAKMMQAPSFSSIFFLQSGFAGVFSKEMTDHNISLIGLSRKRHNHLADYSLMRKMQLKRQVRFIRFCPPCRVLAAPGVPGCSGDGWNI